MYQYSDIRDVQFHVHWTWPVVIKLVFELSKRMEAGSAPVRNNLVVNNKSQLDIDAYMV